MAGLHFENYKKELFDHKFVLRKNLMYMCDNTANIDSICAHLYEKEVITVSEEEKIMSHPTTLLKVRELVNSLEKREIQSYRHFKEVLLATKNEDVFNKLSEFEK